MSRIWDAIKQARRQRLEADAKKTSSAREQPRVPSERRLAVRRALQTELLVYGLAQGTQPFHEQVTTVDASDHGCLLVSEASLAPGQRLFLTNTRNLAEQECRVVRVTQRVHGRIHVGVVFPHPLRQFWTPSGTD